MGTLITITHKEKMSYVVSDSTEPKGNVSHYPNYTIQKILIGRTVFGGDSWCREGRSFLCYFCFVVVYCCFVVGINVSVVFVHVFVLADLFILRCRIG